MNRWLLIGSLSAMMFALTGCCSTGAGGGGCDNGGCASGGSASGIFGGGSGCGPACGGGSFGMSGGGGGCGPAGCLGGGMMGMPGRAAGLLGAGACGGGCGPMGCGRTGCRAGAIGWQQGGLDYSSHLQTGLMGHNAAQNLNSRGFTPGPPSGQVAYPYYTHRGPRDFFVDNPPTIGR